MKKSSLPVFMSLACVLGMLSCSPDSIVIKGKVANAGGKQIVYNRTIDGIYVGMTDTLHLQADSSFIISIPGGKAERFDFALWNARALGSVYPEPGVTELNIDAAAKAPFGEGRTPKEQVMKMLSELDRKVRELRVGNQLKWDITKDKVASSVCKKLQSLAGALDKKISGSDAGLTAKARQDIRMQLLLAFEYRFMKEYYRVYGQDKQDWADAFREMVKFADLNNPENVFSPAFPEAIRNVAGFTIYDIEETAVRPKSMDESCGVLFDWYEENLQGRVREVAMAYSMLDDYRNEVYATGISGLYDRFLVLYPESVLNPLLDEAVSKNKAFNATGLSKDVRFIDTDSVKVFKEITDRFQGKVVFVDFWATWCWSCRRAFEYVEPLQQYAREHDVVLLYVSFDNSSEKAKWMKMANFYDLKGEHAILNEAFKQEIYDTFGENGYIVLPRYAIINSKGKLQFPKASGPEDLDKLISQLKEAAL